MAKIISTLLASTLVPVVDVGLYTISVQVTIPAGVVNGDSIQVAAIPANLRLIDAHLGQPASIGAAATAKLQKNALNGDVRTDITAATTAGGADYERMSVAPQDLVATDVVEILIGGGNPTAGTVLNVDLVLRRK